MNTKFIFLALTLIVTGILFTSCNKNEKFNDFHLLANHEWSLESVSQGESISTSDCDLDNKIIFKESNEFEHDFNIELCIDDFSDENGYSPKSWKLKDNFSTLKLKYNLRDGSSRGNAVLYWKILELTDSTLVLKDDNAEENDMIPEVFKYIR